MLLRRRSLLLLVGLAALTGCAPADLEENLPAYERLVVQTQMEGPDGGLWLTSTAPPDLRKLMLSLRISAVYYDAEAGTIYFRRGGGYMPERGYVYRLPRADTSAAGKAASGYQEEHVVGRWYYRER